MNISKQHWEQVFETKSPKEVSWTQKYPTISMELIQSFKLSKSSSIIDVGGGDSLLVDALLEKGYTNITVLDISEKALLRAQARLGERAKKINWIVSDINVFKPHKNYDLWHDRASFHFLTQKKDIINYTEIVNAYVSTALVIGTFSKEGPERCSGLPITQYSCTSMEENFREKFISEECRVEDHITPFETKQNFTFSRFVKKQ
ncbi:MAG: class I SAM-dependent methyltransferase [Flavobacteriaceae bacterium]|nr:class I SAM-dependent methyltransferase [Flavobacteriaceae bacterium]